MNILKQLQKDAGTKVWKWNCSSIWLGAVEGWRRVSEQIRLRVRGSRWIPAYQAGALTEKQRGLIRTLGFEVE